MELYKLQLIETLIFIIVLIVIKFIIGRLIKRYTLKHKLSIIRRVLIIKVINIILIIIISIVLSTIWGINQNEFFLFISSLLTVLGIALFAQWSILSNITSGIIMFFDNPVKLGSNIKFLDKDYEIEGIVEDIGVFFTIIKTPNNIVISVPNITFLQKSIQVNNDL